MRSRLFLIVAALCAATLEAQPAPVLERITATTSATYDATVRGSAGAVAPAALVAVVNLHTGHYAVVPADKDGAFEAHLFAPGGASILIKADPDGLRLRNALEGKATLGDGGDMIGLAGTVLQTNDPNGSSLSATMTGLSQFQTFPYWVMEARMDKTAYARSDSITIDGTLTIFGTPIAGQTPEINVDLKLVGLSRPDGSGTLDQNTYCSTSMTPTGLPIERTTLAYSGNLDRQQPGLINLGDRLQTTFRLHAVTIPLDIADGYYRPMVLFTTNGIAQSDSRRIGIVSRMDTAARRLEGRSLGLLPVVRLGNPAPPRLYWTLLADTLSQGARGVTAIEDRDRFAVSSRIAVSPDRFVVPRVDASTGAPIRYSLEPYALTVAVSNHSDVINPPTIPFRFPSGGLTVSVKRPNGQTTVLGTAPFRQPRLYGLAGPKGLMDSNYFGDGFLPTTLDPRFEVTFAEDGRHEISVSGTIDDIWGNVWSGRGTYAIDVGRPLEIDSALMPGTPLQVGDTVNASVQLLPAVPADVEVRYRFAPNSRRDLLTERTSRVKATANGYARVEPIPVGEPGEYRVDITASFRDATGGFWSGARTWGSVAAAATPSSVDLHGARGVDDQPAPRLPWFSRKQIGLTKDTGGHVQFSFFSGDVMWLADDDATTPAMRIDDRDRLVTPTLLKYCCAAGISEDLILSGEATFYSVGPNGVDPHAAASADNELWAYVYRFVERPRIRIREMISDETVSHLYWRFDDRYAMQHGTGEHGDRPNDFKFQFGGGAFYGKALSKPVYSTYGSLFVLIANDDPDGTRVFPPFQGNGGGPAGGPLFKFKGREIEMFFHPTAVRPGTIVDVGSVATFAGQIAPMLPSKVEIVVTSPSGATRTIAGQANAVGYFYKPESDFVVSEPGVWRARVKVSHEGRTSGGQLSPPFPAGDVLGSREGEFYVYAAEASAPLAVNATPQVFTVIPPAGLTDVEVYYTATMPGFILEEGKLSGLTYRYEPARLASEFPNLDFDQATGKPAVETITVSFLLSGKDSKGTRRFFGRQVLLQGDEILMPEAARARRRPAAR